MTKTEWDEVSDKYDLSREFQYAMTATEFFGYVVNFTYHFVVIILLLNLLIAKMSQTYSDIVSHADMEWKYQRTIFLTRFMDYNEFFVPPFNVLPRLQFLPDALRGLYFKCLTPRQRKAISSLCCCNKNLFFRKQNAEVGAYIEGGAGTKQEAEAEETKDSQEEAEKELLMTENQKKIYHKFENNLHRRFLHRPLENRCPKCDDQSADVLD